MTFGCLIEACIKNKRIDIADLIFQKVISEDEDKVLEDPEMGLINLNGFQANTVIYTTMIKAFSRTE
jgi:pentatricopeptide repeat protein